ncbi:MAG TPA: hypothetical protein DCE81_01275, partial [Cytophagales bacterium]|nr:hypothetical protein [Cytophagales bacterium]
MVDDVSINPEIYEASPWQTDVVYFRATEASTYLTFSTNTEQRLNQNIEIKDVSVIEEINLFTVCTRYQQPVTPNYLADFTIKCQQNLIDEAAKLKE